jgi:hypothetical protein
VQVVSTSPNFVEEWKGVIDFTKTVLSIATGLLAAFASLLLVGNYKLQGYGWIPPVLLVVAAMASLFGFGRAIQALRANAGKPSSLFLATLSVFTLVAAIASAPFAIQPDTSSIDQALNMIEAATKRWPVDLSARNCSGISRKGDELTISYEANGQTAQVLYSTATKTILQIK